MKLHRFFVEEDVSNGHITITDEKVIHQLLRVLRMNVGDTIVVCDGKGQDAQGEIHEIRNEKVQIHIVKRTKSWLPHKKVHVFLAPIRKERFEWALEKCTELGVASVTPLITERSERGVLKRERAEAIMREAAEQCGRGDIPHYGEPVELTELSGVVFVLDMAGVGLEHIPQKDKEIRLLIGPEGGWTEAERALFVQKQWSSFSLGSTTLRAETAAVVACAKVI